MPSPVSIQYLFKLQFKLISVIKAKLLKNWILEEIYKLPKIHAVKGLQATLWYTLQYLQLLPHPTLTNKSVPNKRTIGLHMHSETRASARLACI